MSSEFCTRKQIAYYSDIMKNKKILLAVFFSLTLVILLVVVLAVPKEWRPQANYIQDCPTRVFDKGALVFDSVLICATSQVPVDKVQHAAHVTAQWLDNDQDGIADNKEINTALRENKAVLLMSEKGFPLIFSIRLFTVADSKGFFGQDLYAVETNNPQRRDASQEETHHLITGAGWAKIHPEIFDDRSENSEIYRAWQYSDENRYYQYDDPTCDNFCKTMEHLYKAIAAYLNSSADLADEEFTIKSSEALRQKHTQMIAIFESEKYAYPNSIWPDGKYRYGENIAYF